MFLLLDFEEFCDRFDAKLPQVLEQIEHENMKIDFRRLSNKMGDSEGKRCFGNSKERNCISKNFVVLLSFID